MKILIVDDDKHVRENIVEIVESNFPHAITIAKTSAEAIETVISKKPHIVLLDLILPDCRDLSTLSQIRKKSPSSLVLMISIEHSDLDTVVSAIKLGAYDYIGKPFSDMQLVHRIKRAEDCIKQREAIKDILKILEDEGRDTTDLIERIPNIWPN